MTDPKILAELRESIKHCYERDVVSIQVSAFRSLISDSERLGEVELKLTLSISNHAVTSAALAEVSKERDQYKTTAEHNYTVAQNYSENLQQQSAQNAHLAERLRLAAEGLGKISTYDDDGTWGNARIKDLARDTLAKIRTNGETPCSQ